MKIPEPLPLEEGMLPIFTELRRMEEREKKEERMHFFINGWGN